MNRVRNKDLGKPGNGGHFAGVTHDEADVTVGIADIRDAAAMDVIRWLDRKETSLSRNDIDAVLDHQHIYVVRALAGSRRHRDGLLEYQQHVLINHPDSTVRLNFITQNSKVPQATLEWLRDTDTDHDVRKAATTELGWRMTVPRPDRDYLEKSYLDPDSATLAAWNEYIELRDLKPDADGNASDDATSNFTSDLFGIFATRGELLLAYQEYSEDDEEDESDYGNFIEIAETPEGIIAFWR